MCLLTAGAVLATADTVAAGSCSDSAGGWGFGGVSMKCSFECEPGEFIGVKITSSDDDAGVDGKASCGGAAANCAGIQACDDNSAPGKVERADGSGDCIGSTSEHWDSSAALSCDTSTDPNGLCLEACVPIEHYGDSATQASGVHLYMQFPLANGWVCDGSTCQAVQPSCWIDVKGWHCGIW